MSTLSTTNLKNPSSGSNNIVLNTDGTTTIAAPSNIIKSGTAVASTSGVAIDFTGIPSWVKKITVMFSGVSLSGSATKFIQLGTGGVATTSGYSGVGGTFYTTNIAGATAYTTAFVINDNTAAAGSSGHAIITNVSGNTWVCSATMCQPSASPAQIFVSAGTVALSGVLNMVRIASSNGTDTFDAGSINILYEG